MLTDEAAYFLRNELAGCSEDVIDLIIKFYIHKNKKHFKIRGLANDIELLFRERLSKLSEKSLP